MKYIYIALGFTTANFIWQLLMEEDWEFAFRLSFFQTAAIFYRGYTAN